MGKADDVGEETGKCTLRPAGIRAQASWERLAEITSRRTMTQQGLAATCKDPPTVVKAERRREGFGLAHEPVGATKRG